VSHTLVVVEVDVMLEQVEQVDQEVAVLELVE
jgi:hypothetical protein